MAPEQPLADETEEELAESAEGEAPEAEESAQEQLQASILAPEERLGGSQAGLGTNDALRAMSRAARSFLLYDAKNEAIRVFLDDYRHKFAEVLAAFGEMELEIRPFELVRGDDVVYLERDRERSLAFRLYRDGVRKLTVGPSTEWNELLKLLEILSIRYTGVRQTEEDIVTLLWKAGFKGIEIEAVEGFVPDEEQPASGRRSASSSKGKRRTTNRVEAPSDWDLPIPEPLDPGQLRYVALTEEDQLRLRGEESSQQIADDAVQLAIDMFEVVCDPTDPTSVTDVAPYLEEVRDFLLAEGQLGRLNDLVATMKKAQLDEVEAEKLERILSTFVGFRAIQRVIRGISKVSIEPPEELIVLLDASGSDPLASLLELLVAERSEIARRMTRQLIERYANNNPEGLIEQVYQLESSVAQDLLRACARALPERAVEASIQLVDRQELGLQLEVLRVLQSAPYAGKVAQALVKLLGSEVLEVRIRVIQQLTERGDSRAFEVMVEHVEATAARGLEHGESEKLGEALAQVDPVQAAKVFSNWIRPRGLFRRFVEVPGQPMMQWTAVAGFEFIVGDAGEKGEKLLRWLAKRSGEEVHKRCMATLARRKLRERDSLAESGEEQGDVA